MLAKKPKQQDTHYTFANSRRVVQDYDKHYFESRHYSETHVLEFLYASGITYFKLCTTSFHHVGLLLQIVQNELTERLRIAADRLGTVHFPDAGIVVDDSL